MMCQLHRLGHLIATAAPATNAISRTHATDAATTGPNPSYIVAVRVPVATEAASRAILGATLARIPPSPRSRALRPAAASGVARRRTAQPLPRGDGVIGSVRVQRQPAAAHQAAARRRLAGAHGGKHGAHALRQLGAAVRPSRVVHTRLAVDAAPPQRSGRKCPGAVRSAATVVSGGSFGDRAHKTLRAPLGTPYFAPRAPLPLRRSSTLPAAGHGGAASPSTAPRMSVGPIGPRAAQGP